MHVFNTILNILFPSRCLSCNASGSYLCLKCLTSCTPCNRENLDWIYSVYDYRDPVIKQAIHALKYKGKRSIATIFAEQMNDKILEDLSEFSVMQNFKHPLLVPIPLSRKRHRERGFNQSTLLCKTLQQLSPKSFTLETNTLIKPKETTHQAHIKDRQKRLKNIIGSFSVQHPEKIKNRNIILIDDVTTTGATLTEAKKVLKNAGAKKIIAVTIAH